MARIKNYVTDNNITDKDIVVGSDGDNSGVTKNFNVATLKSYILQSQDNTKAEWGNITGDLADQTDLTNELNLKADLVGGKVPSTQLPSYVDDVIEVSSYLNLPITGESGKIYITTDTNKSYRWSGSVYLEITSTQVIPTLEQVTGEGNSTENAIVADDLSSKPSYVSNWVSSLGYSGNGYNAKGLIQIREFSGGDGYVSSLSTEVLADNRSLSLPDKNGILAVLTDIPSVDSTPTNGSSNAVSSDGVFDALALKADLVAGKVPSSQLPSYVDDVIEGYYSGGVFYIDSGFVVPITGEVGKIYVDLLLNQSYRWSGSIYVQISNAISGLNDLTDVTVSTPLNGQLIQYNSTTSQWENQSITVGTGDMQKSTYDIDDDGVVDYSETIAITVRNPSVSDVLRKGTIVYLNGSTGYRPNAYKAQANSEATSSGTFGVVVSDIGLNSDGLVAAIGTLHNLDTRTSAGGATYPFTNDTLADGDALWLDPNNAGYVTKVKPSAPNHIVFVGTVARTHPSLGRIVYRITNGYELDELHNVFINGTLADKHTLYYDSATSLWKTNTLANILGFTPVTNARTISTTGPLSGGGNLTADRTLSIAQSNTTTDGYLSSTDWNTFNNKQAALVSSTNIKTINGSSILGSGDLTITGGVQLTRQEFTYSGSQNFTLSATPSYIYLVTVNGQGLKNTQYSFVGTTLTIANTLQTVGGQADEILVIYSETAGGVLDYYTKAQIDAFLTEANIESIIGQASGSNSGYLSSTDWTTFNSKQDAITLTTNNYSGNATFVGGTLNIPNYEGFIPKLRGHETFRGVNYSNNSTTEVTSGGITIATTASTIARSVASTNYATKQVRKGFYGSVVSAGRYTGTRGSALLWYLGGGFKYVCDVYISDTAYGSGCRQFYGMMGQTSDLTYSDSVLVDTMLNVIGIGSDALDTNLQVFHNDGSGVCTKVDLGVNFPANRTAGAALTTVYSIELYNETNASEVKYLVTNKETGATAMGTITTNLPLHTQGLNFTASRCMGGGITNTGQFDLLTLGVYSL